MALQLDQVAAALRSYEIGEEIGRGSTGVVLAAQHRQLGRDVAVKLLTPGFAEDPEVQSRFMAEARMLASFSHVHIVAVYDFVEHDGLCLLVMERLAGGTLASHARASTRRAVRGGNGDLLGAPLRARARGPPPRREARQRPDHGRRAC